MRLYVKYIEITPQDYAAIQSQLRSYINGTNQNPATDPDQPPPPPPKPVPDWVREAEEAGDNYEQL